MSEQDNRIRTGLWKSDKGGYSGKVEIDGREYWVNLYKNDRKEKDNHPDLNLVLKPKEGPRMTPQPASRGGGSLDDDSIPFRQRGKRSHWE